jgi:hypothetical protein
VINDVASARSLAATEIVNIAAAANASLRTNFGIVGLVIRCVFPWVRTLGASDREPSSVHACGASGACLLHLPRMLLEV